MINNFIMNLLLSTMQICGNAAGKCILLNVSDLMEYVEGKATGNIVGQKYLVVCPENRYEKFSVKVKGGKTVITNEQIQQKGGQVTVSFKNLTARLYRANSGEYALSASADGIEVIQ